MDSLYGKNNGLFVFPSEHLVSFYGNDKYAINHQEDDFYIKSKFDIETSKELKINFKSIKDFTIKKTIKL